MYNSACNVTVVQYTCQSQPGVVGAACDGGGVCVTAALRGREAGGTLAGGQLHTGGGGGGMQV